MEELKKRVEATVLLDVSICVCVWPVLERRRTCRHKEDSGAEDDVVARLVELAGGDAQTPHEEQDDAEDGEDAGSPDRTCRWRTHIL